jgi:outer membrane protein OmpA-like peptidoglycan-associated protein
MRAMRLCWFLFLLILIPSPLIGRTDYSTLDPDSPEVQQACEVAVKKLGPDRGAVAIEKTVVDIIGIPKGVAVTGHVAAVETALSDLGAKVTETEIRMELPGDILFDFDKYDIRPDAQEALGKVAVVIRAYPGKAVLIEGHTDSEGSEEYNLKLSLSRAESVKQWLQEKEDLRETNVETKGWGETKPRATNETEEGRQRNRRVEITVKK